jgi:alpha-D-xyloside xylohydrolase
LHCFIFIQKKHLLLNNPIDISEDFYTPENEFFLAGNVTEFNAQKAEGVIEWNFHRWAYDWFFNKIDKHLQPQTEKSAPFQDYDVHPRCKFSISLISQRTFRLRMQTTTATQTERPSLMLVNESPIDKTWKIKKSKKEIIYNSSVGKIVIQKNPWQLKIFGSNNNLLTETKTAQALSGMYSKMLPFLFVRRATDNSRSIAASFSLHTDEKIVGCGESFTALNKRGQKINLFTVDTQSTASQQMYKPIPFFFSNKGYGMFVHTSTPCTFDFGNTHAGSQTLFIGDDALDIFFFIGSPKEILHEYTNLTGKSPMTPLWSFGLWMSRFSYRSQKETLEVAENLRAYKIPCDVIHIDAGWFKKGINCDYSFCEENFPSPKKMMGELNRKGFKTSLWQIPYFTPLNPIFDEVVNEQLFINDGNGNIPTQDAILDFSNEKTKAWYTKKLKALFDLGASCIKADFGEAAPLNGFYASHHSGFYEHNLYALRYNKLVSEITKASTKENIIWARSAWAGSQRYPVHWGGDAEVSDIGMACSLKGGLSLGLSGFTFWSHDIGGFSAVPNEELFKRWAFFGLLSSHSRVHGFPPREPWLFSEDFQNAFRKVAELRYKLMPYIFTQAYIASEQGLPLMKALLLNYPEDETAWFIDDEYLFGDDLLVAPLMENTTARKVYLPFGKWIDYQTKKIYEGEKWHVIEAGELPGILLVRNNSLIPHMELAQSTAFMNWLKIEWIAFSDTQHAEGKLFSPTTNKLQPVSASLQNKQWRFTDNKTATKNFRIKSYI